MDTHRYCCETLERLSRTAPVSGSRLAHQQQILILSSVAQQRLAARDFERQLTLLLGLAERSGRQLLAEATREILLDWQRHAAADREAAS